MDRNLVILAGGVASRMKKATPETAGLDERLRAEAQTLAKAMIGVGRRATPFLDYVVWNARSAGYRNIVMVVGARDESIRGHYTDGPGRERFPDLDFSFVRQPIPEGRTKPLGTADALLHALRGAPSWRGAKLTVINSDNLYSREALHALRMDGHRHALIDYDRVGLRFPPERISAFAVIRKNGSGYLEDIVEKPSPAEVAAATDARGRVGVSMNIFRFSYEEILECVEAVPMHPERQEKELPEAVRMLVRRDPEAVYAIPVSEHVIDLTSQTDIPEVQAHLAREFPEL
jgi:NDP-sugar pyrophosphorylase family protein